MNIHHHLNSLGTLQGQTPYDHQELIRLRQQAWRDQGVLIVSPSDLRLDRKDKIAVICMGERLYGQGGQG